MMRSSSSYFKGLWWASLAAEEKIQWAQFNTQARVVDLLGREQIADGPTAISEVLKNAIDAKAKKVIIHYHQRESCLEIEDDGLGMRQSDLLDKWLTLATNSKRKRIDPEWLKFADEEQLMDKDAPPLGEKGIGRLAVGALGRGVLVWTRWGRGDESQRNLLLIHWDYFRHPDLSNHCGH